MGLTIVLPCFNEEQAIPGVLNELLENKQKIQSQLSLSEIEVIVVDDGSTDKSVELLKSFGEQITVLSFLENSGYGAALKYGFNTAKFDYVVFYDLDCTCHPLDIIPLFNELQKNNAVMALGNRINTDSHMPKIRKLGNSIYANLSTIFFQKKVNDVCSGFRVLKKTFVKQHESQLPDDLSYSLALTLICLINKFPFVEVDINYTERKGDSKLSEWSDGINFFLTILKYKLRLNAK